MAGISEALAAADRHALSLVPGVEISVRGPAGSLHLLGYFREPEPQPLCERLAGIAAYRAARNRRIVERLAELGAPVAWSDVEGRAQGQVGRPHIAAALVAAGHAASVKDAFERFLASDAPAYVEAGSLDPPAAVRLVTESGGAAVLAHPASLRLEPDALEPLVAGMAAAGLRGLEVFRPDHDQERRDAYAELCRRHSLVPCGGSDFHRPGDAEVGDSGDPPLPADAVRRLVGER
jgi:hypothetical protein